MIQLLKGSQNTLSNRPDYGYNLNYGDGSILRMSLRSREYNFLTPHTKGDIL